MMFMMPMPPMMRLMPATAASSSVRMRLMPPALADLGQIADAERVFRAGLHLQLAGAAGL